MAKKFLMGLDLGTNSVGWCVTDENNKIVRKNGKSLWGSRLFEPASDASSRRANRSSRRRLARRKQRVDLLRAMFKEEIDKVDPSFFFRLDESALHREDKHESISAYKYLIFNDKNYTDIDYYAEFPTIYHLRKRLIYSKEKADIRWIYLVLAHMVKYRGNFLNEGQNIQAFDPEEASLLFNELNSELMERGSATLELTSNFVNKLKEEVMAAKGVNKRKEALISVFGITDAYLKNVFVALAAGGTVSTPKIYPDKELDDEDTIDPKKICCGEEDFDENFTKLSGTFSSEPETRIVWTCKKIYDFLLLGSLLGSSKTLSDAMVALHKNHHDQLLELKEFAKKWDAKKGTAIYQLIFGEPFMTKADKKGKIKQEPINNYSRYIGFCSTGHNTINVAHCKREDFYKFIKATFKIDKVKKEELETLDPYLKTILDKMECKEFLLRQNSPENGVFPYQLNLQEMDAILGNQSKFYPFLKQKDADGKTPIEKIESILTFRIPYYVGPLVGKMPEGPFVESMSPEERSDCEKRHSFAWATIKDGNGPVRPWNFDERLDKDQTAQDFIERMLNTCSYLPGKKCLPKQSLLYQEYEVLSFLNKLRINGKFLNYDEKERLINDLFKKKAKVTPKDLKNYYKPENVFLSTAGGAEIDEIPCSLSSYVFFTKETVFGKEFVDSEEGRQIVENIIRDKTVFPEWPIVERRLTHLYGIKNKGQLFNCIKTKTFAGWGKLSNELLELETTIGTDSGEETTKTLIQVMRETNFNLMELISDDRYEFKAKIEEAKSDWNDVFETREQKHESIIKTVDESFVSPGMKRTLIQAMNIVEDVEKILGRPVDEYYVECTRTNKAKKGTKTKSRKELLDSLYRQAVALADADLKKDLERMGGILTAIDNNKLRSDKYFLYFLQMGKDAYTLEEIDLNCLNDYDIDHIVPQSLVKDDSISNRVLTLSKVNRDDKKAIYPIPDAVFKQGRAKTKEYYSFLKRSGLMSDKKFNALTRTAPLTEQDLNSFVNRQLVYTNQAVKALVELLQRYQKTNEGKPPLIVYSKAENVSDFRKEYDILKSRDVNDLHHAHDAYLNICVGRAIDTYYKKYLARTYRGKSTKDFVDAISKRKASLNLENVFKEYFDENGVCCRNQLLDSDGCVAWDYSESVARIKKDIETRFDVLVTTMQCTKGDLFSKVQLKPKGAGNIPAKLFLDEDVNGVIVRRDSPFKDCDKYGGIPSYSYGFCALVEQTRDVGGPCARIVPVPNYYCRPGDERGLTGYLREMGISYSKILLPCLRFNFVVSDGRSKVIVSGVGTAFQNFWIKSAMPLYYRKSETVVVRKLNKLIALVDAEFKGKKDITEEMKNDFVEKSFSVSKDKLILSPAGSKNAEEVILSESELNGLYEKFANLGGNFLGLLTGFISVSSFLKKMQSKELFENLSFLGKARLLKDLVIYFNSNSQSVNLEAIKGRKNAGGTHISDILQSGCSIVAESPTGFYRKVLWKAQ